MSTKFTVYKDLHYKQATFMKNTGKTLEEHLSNARRKLRFARSREQKMDSNDDNIRFWNKSIQRGLLYCGMFHSYEAGRSQLILSVNEDVEEYDLSAAVPPPTKNSKHTEFNEGLLFFGIHKNHVILLQSASLRVGAFVDYLNWLLQDACSEIGKDNRIELDDPIPEKLKDRKGGTRIKSLTISPKFGTSAVVPHGKGAEEQNDLRVKINKRDWEPFVQLFKTLNVDVPHNLLLSGDFRPELIQVNVELKWLGRKKDIVETPVLDAVMRSFRDMDDPPIKATTIDGDEIDGNELRLKKKVGLRADGKIPFSADVFERMTEYLAELKQRGEIAAG